MRVYADGACKGNPGPMAIGVSIQDGDGKEVDTISLEIGLGTNNEAEYLAALEGVTRAHALDPASIELFMDSELVIKQLKGEYQVKNEHLIELYEELQTELGRFKLVSLKQIPRIQNRRANDLARTAFKKETVRV